MEKLKSQGKACESARNSYKNFHKETRKQIAKSRNNYVNGILSEGMKTNSNKPFWKYVKTQKSETIGVAPLKENGQIFSEPIKKASILARQFCSVFTLDDQHAHDTYPHGMYRGHGLLRFLKRVLNVMLLTTVQLALHAWLANNLNI